jgi:hypothetical protein
VRVYDHRQLKKEAKQNQQQEGQNTWKVKGEEEEGKARGEKVFVRTNIYTSLSHKQKRSINQKVSIESKRKGKVKRLKRKKAKNRVRKLIVRLWTNTVHPNQKSPNPEKVE